MRNLNEATSVCAEGGGTSGRLRSRASRWLAIASATGASLFLAACGPPQEEDLTKYESAASLPPIYYDLTTAAPPAVMGGFVMTAFPLDNRPLFQSVTTVPSPLGGSVGFSIPLEHRRIGSAWSTWSHGYRGDVYYTGSATSTTLTLPSGTAAFYLYVEPNLFQTFNITVTAANGNSTTRAVQPVAGEAGARGFGFSSGAGDLASVVVSSTTDFAVGEFGISRNRAPDCSAAYVRPAKLWPPDHRMVDISILGVTDPDGDRVSITATAITQDEVTDGKGDGNTCPDAQLNPLQIRSERSGRGDGRVYRIAFKATDAKGATCSGTVKVGVPHDQSGAPAVDSGGSYNSLVCR